MASSVQEARKGEILTRSTSRLLTSYYKKQKKELLFSNLHVSGVIEKPWDSNLVDFHILKGSPAYHAAQKEKKKENGIF